MLCNAKTRTGNLCQKHGMLNGRCRLHGGLSPKGQDHWNYKHGWCTKESRAKSKDQTQLIRVCKSLLIEIGAIPTDKRKRK
jgi:hypothetical protein